MVIEGGSRGLFQRTDSEHSSLYSPLYEPEKSPEALCAKRAIGLFIRGTIFYIITMIMADCFTTYLLTCKTKLWPVPKLFFCQVAERLCYLRPTSRSKEVATFSLPHPISLAEKRYIIQTRFVFG